MQSFYGGKQGYSFIIVKSFSSVAEMVKAFKLGGNYTEVHYDEHVLIDTKNKNNVDNGKVYRRGYDFTNDLGGAIYVGSIVGPAGRSPMVELTTIEMVKDKQATEGMETRYSEGSYSPTVNLVPGKDGDTYNDAIEWACCSVRDVNGEDTTAYIGFKFPYTVVEYTANSVSPYYNRSNNTNNFTNNKLIDRTDDKAHPYYEQWDIKIPKGIKGDTFKNFKVMIADNTIESYEGQEDDIENQREVLVYEYYNYDRIAEGDKELIYIGDYNMIDNIDVEEDGTIVINYSHDRKVTIDKKIRWISKVTLSQDGELKVEYNNGHEPDVSIIRWVKDITLEDNGTVNIIYNNGDPDVYSKKLRYIVDIYVDTESKDNYTLYFESEDTLSKFLSNQIVQSLLSEDDYEIIDGKNGAKYLYIKDTAEKYFKVTNQADQKIHVVYNTGEIQIIGKPIRFIDKIYMNDDDQKLHIIYNTKEEEVLEQQIKFIDNVYVNDDYRITVLYNTGEENIISEPIKYIKDVYIDTAGKNDVIATIDESLIATLEGRTLALTTENTQVDVTVSEDETTAEITDNSKSQGLVTIGTFGDQKIHIIYNTKEEEIVGEPINYIMRTALTEDYHLIIYYSDPETRQDIVDKGLNYKTGYAGLSDWQDLGSVKDDAGILIGFNINTDEGQYAAYSSISKAIEYLNLSFPNGLTNQNFYGKIVTIGSENKNKRFYAFDYTVIEGKYKGWYYLGELTNDAVTSIVAKEDDTNIENLKNELSVNGVWFIVEGSDDE